MPGGFSGTTSGFARCKRSSFHRPNIGNRVAPTPAHPNAPRPFATANASGLADARRLARDYRVDLCERRHRQAAVSLEHGFAPRCWAADVSASSTSCKMARERDGIRGCQRRHSSTRAKMVPSKARRTAALSSTLIIVWSQCLLVHRVTLCPQFGMVRGLAYLPAHLPICGVPRRARQFHG